MSRAGAQATKVKRLAERADARQRRDEETAFLDAVVAICDGCHFPVVVKHGQDCVCGSATGTFDSHPTMVLQST